VCRLNHGGGKRAAAEQKSGPAIARLFHLQLFCRIFNQAQMGCFPQQRWVHCSMTKRWRMGLGGSGR
jgi:hypothetical protein